MKHGGVSVFAGVGERTREGNDLWLEFQESRRHRRRRTSTKSQAALDLRPDDRAARARACASASPASPSPSTSATTKARTCCSSSTTSSASRRRAPKCRRCSAACRRAVGYQPTLRDRDGRAAGAHHLDQEGLDHLGAGDLRARRRLHRPGAGDDVRPPRRDHEPVARRSPSSASTRPSIRWPRPRASSIRASSARSTTTSRAR